MTSIRVTLASAFQSILEEFGFDAPNVPRRLQYDFDTSAYPARPENAPLGMCDYIGPVEPTDWESGDFWIDNS